MLWKITIHLISMLFLMAGCLISGIYAVLKLYSGQAEIIEWEILELNSTSIVFTLIFDWVSLLFICFVFLISSSVLYYSGEYMKEDKSFNRFMYLVLMFVFSMGAMVLSPNLISILLGWDGLGLVSYVLVIYYQNEKSANAGMLTVLSNRVGDVAILLSIGFMIKLGSWNFLFYAYSMSDKEWLGFKFLIILAAMTKSAQIPFSAWLPAAMAAPTPVSALVHSSTLVTAGVYLMIRFSPILESFYTQSWLLIISCLTMFMAGLGANFEYDLKKIIALSTLSQLGVMLSILALGFFDLAFFHLLSHALFKALLFMCAGVFIHGVGDHQDIRYMGCLVKFMPLSVIYMSVCNFALCGFPFLAGFYSKDMILEVAFMSWVNFIALSMYVLAVGLTVSYTMRLIFYSLSGGFNLGLLANMKDSNNLMTISMSLLGTGAIIGGAALSWLLFPEPYMICLSALMKSLVMMVSIIGGVIGYVCNLFSMNHSSLGLSKYFMVVFMGSMWFMPFLSTMKNSYVMMNMGGLMEKIGDKGWLEKFGPQGLYLKLSQLFMILNSFQINKIKVFMKVFILGVLVVMFMGI
uniref:NADH-ubiquinone oxidoreductase chain 5 n=1 Tax=Indochinamon bhumibol TaxID=2771976 RepID=A0A7H9SU40_9EUCA|nr:NADH dehydrogenase subunit 5 [Indochinamon bhumibol]QNT10760.1 NADH dehydrogenase subunit 5 [Indochinamon bhumibol]BCL51422.1 NADH dehydrogenase subunit 5 [Indochinamon bhumibol]